MLGRGTSESSRPIPGALQGDSFRNPGASPPRRARKVSASSLANYGEPGLLIGRERDIAFFTTETTVDLDFGLLPAEAADAIGAFREE